jgi:hypothetical protein
MNTSNLSESVKSSFLKSVKLDTNVNTLKRKIQTTIQNLKTQTSRRGKLRTELKVYLNSLDLTNDVKKQLIGSVGDDTKSIESLKRRASQMVKQAQKGRLRREMRRTAGKRQESRVQAKIVRGKARAVQRTVSRKQKLEEKKEREQKKLEEKKEREQKKLEEKKRQEKKPVLEKHLFGLTHLSKREINAYMKSFMTGKTDLTKTITLSSAKDKQNEKSKNFLLTFVSKLPIKTEMKQSYLKSLKVPRADIAVIRTKLRNYVIKQPMPTKEKKRIVDQLLGLK